MKWTYFFVAVIVAIVVGCITESLTKHAWERRIAEMVTEYESQPPSVETLTVVESLPAILKTDTLEHERVIFKPDPNAMLRDYPYAIWRVNYDNLTQPGRLAVTFYNGTRRDDINVASFFIEGDDELTYKSTDITPPRSQPESRGWGYFQLGLLGSTYYTSQLNYDLYLTGSFVAFDRLEVGLFGGATKSVQFSPKFGAFAKVALYRR